MKLLQNFAHTNLASPSGPKVHSNHAVAMLAWRPELFAGAPSKW
ncbi:hypothetical protein CA51_26750 [Rosistilla oblonga]|nr:hypothetical protein CA51_26750 [Rosistilla oblonga]